MTQINHFNEVRDQNRRVRIGEFIRSLGQNDLSLRGTLEELVEEVFQLGKNYSFEYNSSWFLVARFILEYGAKPEDILSNDQVSILSDEVIPEVTKIQLLQSSIDNANGNAPNQLT